MKLITYNINGIRAAAKKGLIDWVEAEDPDIICFQEIKALEEQMPMEEMAELGYQGYVHSAEKKGYSGVATFAKKKAKLIEATTGMPDYDSEGRILRTDFGAWTLLNCYFPSGSSGEERHAFKMKYLEDFGQWVKALLKERKKLIVVGDYNIVHLDHDIHNPQRKDKPSGFRPEEREWMNQWFEEDFVDAFRYLHPDVTDNFSWWSYRMGARKRNKGWRIDYISISKNLKSKIEASGQLHDAVHSDHCPVYVEIKI